MRALNKGPFKHAEHMRKEPMCELSISIRTDASNKPTHQELIFRYAQRAIRILMMPSSPRKVGGALRSDL
jgi:hypothetical protein